jgi:hypothetical protein
MGREKIYEVDRDRYLIDSCFKEKEWKEVVRSDSLARHRWLTPIILATQEAKIRRISVPSQPRQVVCETLSQKTLHKNRVGGVAQAEGPEFKPQYCKKQKQKEEEDAEEW